MSLQQLLAAFPRMPIGPTNKWSDVDTTAHKRPAVSWAQMISSNTEKIAEAEARSNFNKFGRTGKDFNVFVVDVDAKDGGLAAWTALCSRPSKSAKERLSRSGSPPIFAF